MTEIICVPIIVALTYAIIELYKKVIAKENQTLNRIIPLLGLAIGSVAGIVCFYAFPELIIAHNLLSAIIVGASSGLSATGCNQIFKQLKKYGINVTEPENAAADDSGLGSADGNVLDAEEFKTQNDEDTNLKNPEEDKK